MSDRDIHREGNPLRAWRRTHKASLLKVAAALGVSAMTVREWEAESMTPRPENLARVAALMGINKEALRLAWERWQSGLIVES